MKKLFLMVAMLFVVNGTLVAQEPTPATPEVEVKEQDLKDLPKNRY